jgi:hypothetical protein
MPIYLRTKSCDATIQRHVDTLNQMPGVKNVVAFYYYRLGDKQQLKITATDFDKETKTTGNHWTLKLFGILDNYDAIQ